MSSCLRRVSSFFLVSQVVLFWIACRPFCILFVGSRRGVFASFDVAGRLCRDLFVTCYMFQLFEEIGFVEDAYYQPLT